MSLCTESCLFSGFENMDSALKPCTLISIKAKGDKLRKYGIDRLSSLPDMILGEILCFLTTKEAVATSLLSRRWRHVFTWIKSLEFDDSPTCHCLECPSGLEGFASFNIFVNGVLQAWQSRTLTRFSLKVGKGENARLTYLDRWLSNGLGRPLKPRHECNQSCFPELNPIHVNSWICFPIAHGVKELDLCIHVEKPGKVPRELYSGKTLVVLKLDLNLELQVPTMFFCFPYLKVLHLKSVLISDDDSLTRLVSSCPSLEDLAVKGCKCKTVRVINVSAPFLRRLAIDLFPAEFQRFDVVLNTPNLQYLLYTDSFALRYSIGDLSGVVEAYFLINTGDDFPGTDLDYVNLTYSMLSILRSLSNVQHLALLGAFLQGLTLSETKLELPVLSNLNNLELGVTDGMTWSQFLLELLNYSPFIERLAFQQGLIADDMDEDAGIHLAAEEYPYWSTVQAVPSCLMFHLRRIEIKEYLGVEWELEVIKYFLRNASVLEEFIITLYPNTKIVDGMQFESTLKKLPRASTACSIQVLLPTISEEA